jgi:hypothetical protein
MEKHENHGLATGTNLLISTLWSLPGPEADLLQPPMVLLEAGLSSCEEGQGFSTGWHGERTLQGGSCHFPLEIPLGKGLNFP